MASTVNSVHDRALQFHELGRKTRYLGKDGGMAILKLVDAMGVKIHEHADGSRILLDDLSDSQLTTLMEKVEKVTIIKPSNLI